MRSPTLVFAFLLGSAAAGWAENDPRIELRHFRDDLMRRTVKVSWLKPEVEARYLENRRRIREQPGTSLEGFKFNDFAEPKVPLEITRWSEWPGHWLSIGQILSDPTRYQRILQVQQSVATLTPAQLPLSPLEQLELHHDFLEMAELLGEQLKVEEELGQGATPPRFPEKRAILAALLALMDRFALNDNQMKQLPVFDVQSFAKDKVDPSLKYAFLVDTGFLRHDIEAHFRTSGLIYVLVSNPKSSILDWLAGRIPNPKKGDQGTLIMADRMLAYSPEGHASFQFPKTIRLEDIEGTGFSVFSSSYTTYRLDGERSPAPVFRKLKDDAGGVPLAELPNVHNPWRTQLFISCVQCHASSPRLKSNIVRPIRPVTTLPDDTVILANRGKDPILAYAKKIIALEHAVTHEN